VPLDFAGALLGALVQWTGAAAGQRLRRLSAGTPAQAALRKIVTAAIEPAVLKVCDPTVSEAVSAAVTEHLGHRMDLDPAQMSIPDLVLRAWLTPLTDQTSHSGATGYLHGHGVDAADLADSLQQQILLGIHADAMDNGPLAPLWQELAAADRDRRAVDRDHGFALMLAGISRQTVEVLARLGTSPAPISAGEVGLPVGQVRPLDLGVHPAIDAGAAAAGLTELPAYIPRHHDAALADMVAEVQSCGDARMVVLVGGSSTGKTRACWEAVRALPPPWRLWHPLRPGRPEAALADLERVGPHTVVWMNEAQHYLLTPAGPAGEQVAAELRTLLASPGRGPVLVLGTLWPDNWTILTAVPPAGQPDPHAQARDLLKNTSIRIPDAFTADDLRTAVRERDPRLAEALNKARSGAVTQYLAGGPALIERYEKAGVAAKAVLHAAMDARRLGHGPALPRLLLEEAAAGYLSDDQWDLLTDDWLEKAFAYLTDPLPCRGARAPLTRIKPRPAATTLHRPDVAEPGYRLADYLEQHGARTRRMICPPAGFWDAATHHAATGDHTALADAARDRGRYRHAYALWQRAADTGYSSALGDIARLRERTGDHEEAERLAHAAADAGHTGTLRNLADLRGRTGDWEGAERLARAAAAGHPDALQDLTRLRGQAGDHEEAERLARAAADAGHPEALWILAEVRERADDREEGERLAYAAADAGHPNALQDLARLREWAGDHREAERLYRLAADAGHTYALLSLGRLRTRAEDHEEAIRLLQLAADAGHSVALWHMADLREQAGDHREAERLYLLAADAGHPGALVNLAEWREEAGDYKEVERLYRLAADAGHPDALRNLVLLRVDAGDREEAERLARAAGHAGALWILAELREDAGDREEAEQLAYAAADAGYPGALGGLVMRRENAGDHEEAERLAYAAADASYPGALGDLARLREAAGDHREAEQLARAAADAGYPAALGNLAKLREDAGDREEAERLTYAAADAGYIGALGTWPNCAGRPGTMRKPNGWPTPPPTPATPSRWQSWLSCARRPETAKEPNGWPSPPSTPAAPTPSRSWFACAGEPMGTAER
jgi:TPR repeat protein